MSSAQDILMGSRVAHVRELKTEIERLKAVNARLNDERASLCAHFDLALLAAEDLRALPENGRMVIVDGWNMILGAQKRARDRADLVARAKAHIAAHPDDFVWIVLDGAREDVRIEGRVRVSYTGGTGLHRADKFICDYLRMARYLGLADRIDVRTNDGDLLRQVGKLQKSS